MSNEDRVTELLLAWEERLERGQPHDPEELCRHCPEALPQLQQRIRELQALQPMLNSVATCAGGTQAQTGPGRSSNGIGSLPPRLGRYRVVARIGSGGFGIVYKGYDEDLQRDVAIKIPHHNRIVAHEDVEAYLAEGRAVAGLDHPAIVSVYDVGRTEDGLCYLVSRFIEGSDLALRLSQSRPSRAEAVEIVARVAEALHHAHQRGLVHRDIKPANILLDVAGRPIVADFGLALREEDFGKGPAFAGTPAYMSPEQARGEGHRVDARTDVYSLGAVFYEMLTRLPPFRGKNLSELLEQITTLEPRPPRHFDDNIPREIDRICLKAISKRPSDRFSTALDMAEDLRHWQAGQAAMAAPLSPTPPDSREHPAATRTSSVGRESDQQSLKVLPRGLRSFDTSDANFFLELLPGPRERTGLPDSVCFWKSRIETTDSDRLFSVGLLYGPSGCGKSSLVKAGLLPRLAQNVRTIYLEAMPDGTEARLLKGLHKHCPTLPANLGLVDALARLRRGSSLPAGTKVLIVLDQFEQWLHSRRQEQPSALVQALRQCDGEHLQCLVLVRDDFWMAATRFLGELEVRLVEGHNAAAVDLFGPRHARRVLAAFGRAFGALAEEEVTREQERFLDQAVAGLDQNGKITPVRLSLFAEMIKGKRWSLETLKAVGGPQGVGVTFLEETFSAATAPPAHRLHQQAARAVLSALLPEQGTDLKGHMRSRQELLTASGYASRPREFEDLLHILDGELRLITPTDTDGVATKRERGDPAPGSPSTADDSTPNAYYQLTHDYLVSSLRQWLTRKQRETFHGRAELRLTQRTAQWEARPENRSLPPWWEWVNILLFTRWYSWTPLQRKLMRRAWRYHGGCAAVLFLALALAAVAAQEWRSSLRAGALVRSLQSAETKAVPQIVEDISPYRRWANPLLVKMAAQAVTEKDRLHASLALLPVDSEQVEYLHQRLGTAQPQELLVIRQALLPFKDQMTDRLWKLAEHSRTPREQRFRAASTLAAFDPDSPRWNHVSTSTVASLVTRSSGELPHLLELFRPVRLHLVVPLSVVYRSRENASERTLATALLNEYAADNAELLADLLQDADKRQYAVLLPRLLAHRERAVELMNQELDRTFPPSSGQGMMNSRHEATRDHLARRQALAAVTLLHLGYDRRVWPLLKYDPEPRVRSHLLHSLGPLGIEVLTVLRRLRQEEDVSARQALLLALGDYEVNALSGELRESILQQLLATYRQDPHPGIHSAAEWLLSQRWGLAADLRAIRSSFAAEPRANRHWYVSPGGQTFTVIGPGVFLMGSPPEQPDRSSNEGLHRKRIVRSFSLATTKVTVEQFQLFLQASPEVRREHNLTKEYSPDPTCPIISVTWYEAAKYCRWLSEREGVRSEEMCYPPVEEIKDGMKLPANYLSRTGYRLPTEAEWEYAARAGTQTSRFFGSSEALLSEYAWHLTNSKDRTWPVGQLRPNSLGIFDIHGNVWDWCQERAAPYPATATGKATLDVEDPFPVRDSEHRIVRGGAFNSRAFFVRVAYRNVYNGPAFRGNTVGFRLARTHR